MLEYENFIKIIAFIMISKYFFYLISFLLKNSCFSIESYFVGVLIIFFILLSFSKILLFIDHTKIIIMLSSNLISFFFDQLKKMFLCSFFPFFPFYTVFALMKTSSANIKTEKDFLHQIHFQSMIIETFQKIYHSSVKLIYIMKWLIAIFNIHPTYLNNLSVSMKVKAGNNSVNHIQILLIFPNSK